MKRTAIGIRVHSGWGALIAIAGDAASPQLIERGRIVIIDPKSSGAAQPYHFAKNLKLTEAEQHIARSAAASARLAEEALREITGRLAQSGFIVAGAALLLSAGRTLPPLPRVLAAHPLIHTAEGEFFREAFRHALEQLCIRVTGIRERELEARSAAVFGKSAVQLPSRIDSAARSLGPPWTQDQKLAALAAMVVLADRKSTTKSMRAAID